MGNYTSGKRFQAIYDTVKIVYKTTRNQEKVTIHKQTNKKRFSQNQIKNNLIHISNSHKTSA